MKSERVTGTDFRPPDESCTEAIAAVREELESRHDIARIDKADASRRGGAGDWAVSVTGVLSTEGDDAQD